MSAPLLEPSPEGLRCARGSFDVDPWGAAATAVITHVHGDHLVAGSARYICSAPSLPFLRKRLGPDVEVFPIRRLDGEGRTPSGGRAS